MNARTRRPPSDQHWNFALSLAPRIAMRRRSLHVTTRDGTAIALDVWLAEDGSTAKRPTILRATRYYRGIDVRRPFERTPVVELPDNHANTRRLFVGAGYAWVDMDVRGSGASFGTQSVPWSDEEVRDGGEIVDWIIAQPWSSGRVGALGISYDGTSAERLGYLAHPAVQAVAPLFSLFDVYADVAFPGGVHLAGFTDAWSRFNRTLDDGAFTTAMASAIWHIVRSALPVEGLGAQLVALADALTRERFIALVAPILDAMVVGVRAVDDDRDRAKIAAATREHQQNVDVHAGALRLKCRDDQGLSDTQPERSIDEFSPHTFHKNAPEHLAIYSVSGWRDGAYQRAATHRFASVRSEGSKLLLGPWCHGGKIFAAPDSPTRAAGFDLDRELLRWFDWRLRDRDDGIATEPAVRYFATGEERWLGAETWPPPGTEVHTLYAATARALSESSPARDEGDDLVRVDNSVGAGPATRWNTLLGGMIRGDYPDRHLRDGALLTYTSHALTESLAMVGHGRVVLCLETPAKDLTVHVYLEEVCPGGAVHHVTEGVLRATHRATQSEGPYETHAPYRSHRRDALLPLPDREPVELVVELLPTAHVFRPGRSVRLAIAFADRDHFVADSTQGALVRVLRDRVCSTRVELPVERTRA
ncbi:MAG: CocE/NonD family hydrolase [Deltaproteobacteria bacterium]|nr:CocE/NonD family hydrolase [Deltaproteobacteria bacterium]